MFEEIIHTLKHAGMISGFVFIMMLLIEYVNVQTRGGWQKILHKQRWIQYFVAVVLGAIPGCLGSFMAVTLYMHRAMSLGALVATMIASSGDEAFFMLAMIPDKFLAVSGWLIGIGLVTGVLVDLIFKNKAVLYSGAELPLHADEKCKCLPYNNIAEYLKHISFERILLILFMLVGFFMVATGTIADEAVTWIRVTLMVVTFIGLFIVVTVPDHFLEHHIWEHIMKKHLLSLFLWTFGALLVVEIAVPYLNMEEWIKASPLIFLLLATIVGIIPEAGPHMIFVTMFSGGLIPMYILIANSIVQDGHGMLPLLAHSRKEFIKVKSINLVAGLLFGLVGMWIFG